MSVEFSVTSHKLGATLHCSGESANLVTDTEIDMAVERIKSKLDAAAAKAKRAIRAESKKGAYA